MAAKPRVVIAGGSLGGLTAALVLRDIGCDVDVFERSRHPLAGRGVGIVAHPATIRYPLERGAGDPTSGVTFMRYLDERGGIAHEEETNFRFTSYYSLYRALLDLFGTEHYHLGCEVTGFQPAGTRVAVDLRGNGREVCDLLVCADGIQSRSRQQLLPGLERQYAGYVGWRGAVDESELSDEARAAVDDALVYYVGPHTHILTYPIPSPEQGGGAHTLNWVWYRNVPSDELDELMIDSTGTRREISLTPGMVRDEPTAELRRAAAEQLPPQLAEAVRSTSEPFLQVVFDIEAPRMAFGRICLLGDAASALRPHVAAGTAKAAEAAWMLADAVRDCEFDIPRALERWEPRALELEHDALARTREAGVRMQFENRWGIGEPIPYGLRESGDSALPSPR